MKKILLVLGAISAIGMSAQRSCGTSQVMKNFFSKNAVANANKESLRNFLINNDHSTSNKQDAVITIPVVVHVLYKNAAQNVSEAQIMSQLAVLNKDFRKQNTDFSTVVPAAFQSVAGDLELAFCLATKKPDGTATTGIERKSIPSNFTFGNDYYKTSGLQAWDPTKYLNIWVGNFDGYDEDGQPWDGVLGFAYLPDAAGMPYDGLCIGFQSFGTTGAASYPFNLGRTGTHEIGHYLGLEHVWGEANYGDDPDRSVCGTAGWSDGCADTPATFYPHFTKPSNINVYTCTSTPQGAMFMNFMDYVEDRQMALFTNDQKTITKNTMIGPRASLLNSNACSALAVGDVEKSNSINVFPNPTTNYISVSSPLVKINEVEIFSAEGKLVKRANIKNETDKIDVKQLPVGTYFVRTYDQGNFVKSMKFIKK